MLSFESTSTPRSSAICRRPVGARRLYYREDDGNGNWSRMFSERVIELPALAEALRQASMDIEGWQYGDGSIKRCGYAREIRSSARDDAWITCGEV
jgi:hypothetical protein